jgi:chemotaxis protein histidine kinase CheA
MGDGRVALILDLAGLVRMAGEQPNRADTTMSVWDSDRSTKTHNKLTAASSNPVAHN